jgi:aminoglycoside phosphotransferase (APT) family kinase protein
LHQVDYVAAGLAELGKPGGYLARQVSGWIERYHGSKTHDYPEVEEISRWLKQNLPKTTQSAALIHNDYKFDNVILDAGDITKIAGVLDWEMCTIGDPLADLGTTLAYWADPSDPDELRENLSEVTTLEGSLTRSQMAEHYARKTGCDISHMAFYLALARFKLAVIVQQIFYRYHQGLTRDPRFAALPARIAALFRASLSAARGRAI